MCTQNLFSTGFDWIRLAHSAHFHRNNVEQQSPRGRITKIIAVFFFVLIFIFYFCLSHPCSFFFIIRPNYFCSSSSSLFLSLCLSLAFSVLSFGLISFDYLIISFSNKIYIRIHQFCWPNQMCLSTLVQWWLAFQYSENHGNQMRKEKPRYICVCVCLLWIVVLDNLNVEWSLAASFIASIR